MTQKNERPNPFGGKPPATPPARQPESRMTQEEPPEGGLCPFMGGVPVPMIDESKSALLVPGKNFNPLDAIQTGVAFQACQRESCMLWNKAEQTCQMKLAAIAQVEAAATLKAVKVALEPLAGWFGGSGR